MYKKMSIWRNPRRELIAMTRNVNNNHYHLIDLGVRETQIRVYSCRLCNIDRVARYLYSGMVPICHRHYNINNPRVHIIVYYRLMRNRNYYPGIFLIRNAHIPHRVGYNDDTNK
jgi:hypothetical protein